MTRLWRLAEVLAMRITQSAGLRGRRPASGDAHDHRVDVHALADAFGVRVQPDVPMAQEGLLMPYQGGWQILVAQHVPAVRARFTVAHELAHLALKEPEIGGRAAQQALDPQRGFRSVERLCDSVAAAMLLPTATTLLIDRDGQPPHSPDCRSEHLRRTYHVACQTDTSLSAAFIRLHGLLRWRSSLVQWKLGARGWFVQTESGLSVTGLHLPLVGGQVEPTLHRLHAGARDGIFAESLPLLGSGRCLRADVVVGTRTITTVIDHVTDDQALASQAHPHQGWTWAATA